MMKSRKYLSSLFVLLFIGLFCLTSACSPKQEEGHEGEQHEGEEHEGEDHEGEEKENESEVHLSTDMLKTLHIEYGTVTKTALYEEIFATGKVVQDTDKMAYAFAPSTGVITKISSRVGQYVKQGQTLLLINGTPLPAPKNGTIISINASAGTKVGAMTSIVTLANLGTIRAVLDVYPKDIDKVAVGQKVRVELIGHEQHDFEGTIKYVSPSLDEVSQTLKVGVDIKNTESHLKFGMFVQGQILYKPTKEILTIPEEALVRFDRDFAVFVVGDEEGAFEKVPIRIGQRGHQRVEVIEGIQEGAKVVTKGSFMLKAESLRGSMGEGHAH